MVPLYNSFGV
ncbi:hypothetical protein E2C01_094468 [Portunus trituberculatus]|uniref:Uncharacterized protein n=1 Tax=Portunus trituberculatus TaxID=210409 RepID=A0A5B7JX88_PORTR|nr:hypothetical protein [Portunus trituberculatus]